MRIRSLLSPSTLLVLLALFSAGACKKGEAEIVEALRGTWSVTDVLGQTETVRFDEDRIVWGYGTETQYDGPYRVASHQLGEVEGKMIRKVEIRLRCKRRTGTDDWIRYRLLFREDLNEFEMWHGEKYDIPDGVFVAVPE